ncbi:type II CAAX prenyl endopeptidase Rce1 family protein [Kitasatospora sp. NPDC098663]|uniref:CPBP family glutamic-type intramembrane protease n=1 Tax=Kitasatospora sp. NPDC098663 TaxID=3364096 RepID=UPI003830EB70
MTSPSAAHAPHLGSRRLLPLILYVAAFPAAALDAVRLLTGPLGLPFLDTPARWAAATTAGAVGAAVASAGLRVRRTRAHGGRLPWRDPLTVAPLLGAATVVALVGVHQIWAHAACIAIVPAVAAALAVELCHLAGVPVQRLLRDPAKPATSWTGLSMGVQYTLWLLVSGILAVAVARIAPASAPAAPQIVQLGFDRGDLLMPIVTALTAGVLEEGVLTAGLVVLGQAARLPTPAILIAAAAARITLHLYLGLPGATSALFAVAAVLLFLRHGRLLPLVAAHTAYDLATIGAQIWT